MKDELAETMIDLSMASIQYSATARAGPLVVLIHAPLIDFSPPRDVMDELAPQSR